MTTKQRRDGYLRARSRTGWVVLALLLLLFRHGASAFSLQAAQKKIFSDGSYNDTAAAVADVRSRNENGWILTVGQPGGSYTWSEQLTINVGRDFTIQGASPTVLTQIRSTYSGAIAIFVDAGAGKLFTMQDLSFSGWSATGRLMEIVGTGECFHLSNLRIEATYQNSPWLWIDDPNSVGSGDGPFGLIDNCTMSGYAAAFVRQNRSSADAQWVNNHSIAWGTRNAVFFEDINYTGAASGAPSFLTDGNQAGRIVVRHCTLKNAVVGWHGRDSGGTAGQDYKHGFLSGEVYENTYNVTRPMGVPLVLVRSGTALVWGNRLNISEGGEVATGVQLQTHCAGPNYVNCLNCSDGQPMSQPLRYPQDYPDCQQAGKPQPVRVWGNTNGQRITYGWCVGDTEFTGANREYFVSDDNGAKPAGYTPFTYPHPLNTRSLLRPTPPTNLHVVP